MFVLHSANLGSISGTIYSYQTLPPAPQHCQEQSPEHRAKTKLWSPLDVTIPQLKTFPFEVYWFLTGEVRLETKPRMLQCYSQHGAILRLQSWAWACPDVTHSSFMLVPFKDHWKSFLSDVTAEASIWHLWAWVGCRNPMACWWSQ